MNASVSNFTQLMLILTLLNNSANEEGAAAFALELRAVGCQVCVCCVSVCVYIYT